MQFYVPKVKLVGNWDKHIKSLSYYSYNNIYACSIKSASGNVEDLNKSIDGDNKKNYKYTKLIDIASLRTLVSYFKLDTLRIRILKQPPQKKTYIVTSNDSTDIIRIWISLNEDENFYFFFDDNQSINLKVGELVFFNPNSLHGYKNSSNIDRYFLEICSIPNLWLKELLEVKDKVIFLRE
jgi:hypothetical protein